MLRRGFEIAAGDRFIVAEDVVTRGGRVQETIAIVRAHGGIVAAVAAIVDRSGGNLPDFGCPFIALTQLDVMSLDPETIIDRETYDNPEQLADGVVHVFVNGTLAWTEKGATPSRNGRFLPRITAAH